MDQTINIKANYFVQELDEPVRVNRLRTGC